jgi:hypothetical protein
VGVQVLTVLIAVGIYVVFSKLWKPAEKPKAAASKPAKQAASYDERNVVAKMKVRV